MPTQECAWLALGSNLFYSRVATCKQAGPHCALAKRAIYHSETLSSPDSRAGGRVVLSLTSPPQAFHHGSHHRHFMISHTLVVADWPPLTVVEAQQADADWKEREREGDGSPVCPRALQENNGRERILQTPPLHLACGSVLILPR